MNTKNSESISSMVTNKITNKISFFNKNNSFNLFNKMVYVHETAITKTYSKVLNTFKTFNERPLSSLTYIFQADSDYLKVFCLLLMYKCVIVTKVFFFTPLLLFAFRLI